MPSKSITIFYCSIISAHIFSSRLFSWRYKKWAYYWIVSGKSTQYLPGISKMFSNIYVYIFVSNRQEVKKDNLFTLIFCSLKFNLCRFQLKCDGIRCAITFQTQSTTRCNTKTSLFPNISHLRLPHYFRKEQAYFPYTVFSYCFVWWKHSEVLKYEINLYLYCF